jgi:hypothetical protein
MGARSEAASEPFGADDGDASPASTVYQWSAVSPSQAPQPLEPVRVGPPPAAPGRSGAPTTIRPRLLTFLVLYVAALCLAWLARNLDTGALSWYTTVVWTLPILASLIGLSGAIVSVRRTRRERRAPEGRPAMVAEPLIVLVPTIGRDDTYPALKRVVASYCRHLPELFPRLRIDVLIEQDCEARDDILHLAEDNPLIRVLTVPRSYRTVKSTRFKARANHYAHERRIAEGEARADVWVLHMDDDTGVGPDTAASLARFVNAQRQAGADASHLAQGVLAYPREHATSRITWLADAIRPGCDISQFAATTGRGRPLAGLHGELLLVRASVEAEIGWDFGPRTIVEDAQFALYFCEVYPGRSEWISGRSYGASPVTVRDLIKQRERWAWGLLELAVNRSVPLRRRLLLVHNVTIWAVGPLQHVALVLLAGALLGDLNTFPISAAFLPVWAVNVAYGNWQYWEGLKINALSSGRGRRLWWEPLCLLPLIPLFSVWEAAGVLRATVRFLRHGESTFTVIAKPR